ncbi:MAG: GNAT family N-acetyltransferase [Candidatus Nealsonbacteria bacterium]|nr:GNAT family N-acetyltransferase [Candidatus Nealsonbacteria bacterium]
MQVYCLCDLNELAPYADDWDRLAGGVPTRSWAWLSTWWKHYGQPAGDAPSSRRLFVPCVFDRTEKLVAVAPWYCESSAAGGSVVRPLGSGEVCSDYLGLLCQPGIERQITTAVADYLTGVSGDDDCDGPAWDLLELTGIDGQDAAVGQLVERLEEAGNTVHHRDGPNCWRIELPESWDAYLAMLSKSHRKQIRRLQRDLLDTGRAVLHTVTRADELPAAIDVLIDLHQRRRQSLGEPGCFASPAFAAFHREVMPRLLRSGQLQLHWLELDGRPVAAEYQLAGGGVVYAYQSGIEPELAQQQPGRIATVAALRRAIEHGYRALDFLRGDEPYKAHFRAEPRPSMAVRIVPNRPTAQWRHNLWLAGDNMKHWLKSGLHFAGVR